MAATQLTYQDYIEKLSVQDVLSDAGYKLNRRDGLRYPCYVRLDSDGRRVRGDKFVVTQAGKCCFKPPVVKSYNIISLIKDFPEMFKESADGVKGDRLVNMVCRRILNIPEDQRQSSVSDIRKQQRPFDLGRYTIIPFDKKDRNSQKAFYPFFKHRGIGLMTQYIFRDNLMLASHTNDKGRKITNLSFPLRIPGQKDIVGFEERGRMRLDGGKGYKGKAEGSNGSEALWIASPNNVRLENARDVYWFESAYDAMAYFQTHIRENYTLYKSVFVSTGGTPTVMQTKGMLEITPAACHHLCFDNDLAGKQFVRNFYDTSRKMCPLAMENVPRDMQEFVDSYRYMPVAEGQSYFDVLKLQMNPSLDGEKSNSFVKEMVPDLKDVLDKVDEHYAFLPKDLRSLYDEYASARDERESLRESGSENSLEYKYSDVKVSETRSRLENAIKERLNVRSEGVVDMPVLEREIPDDGYKDWNDELLGEQDDRKRGGTVRTTINTGLDLDGDGEDDTIETEQNVEDRKQHIARHH